MLRHVYIAYLIVNSIILQFLRKPNFYNASCLNNVIYSGCWDLLHNN